MQNLKNMKEIQDANITKIKEINQEALKHHHEKISCQHQELKQTNKEYLEIQVA